MLNSSSRTRPQTHFICDSLLCVQHRFYLLPLIYKLFVLLCSPILPTAFLLSVITHHSLDFHPVTQTFSNTRRKKFTWCVENLQATTAFRTDDALLLRLVRRELAAGTRRAKVTTTDKIQEILPVTWRHLIIVLNNLHSIGQQELLHPGVHLHLNCYQPCTETLNADISLHCISEEQPWKWLPASGIWVYNWLTTSPGASTLPVWWEEPMSASTSSGGLAFQSRKLSHEEPLSCAVESILSTHRTVVQQLLCSTACCSATERVTGTL